MRLPLLATLCWGALAPGVRAQTPAVDPGDRVRIRLEREGARPLIGTVVAVSDDRLELRDRDDAAVFVLLDSIGTLQRSVGRRSNTARGAWTGLTVGALAGLAIGKATDPHSDCWGNADEGSCPFWLWGGGLFGAVGAGIGALVGGATKTDMWEAVRMGGGPGRDGRLRLAVGWSVPWG